MNQDEIIEMAKQFCPYQSEEFRNAYYDGFMKASKLVAQYEREACAEEADHWQKIGQNPKHKCGEYIAAAIRARGQE